MTEDMMVEVESRGDRGYTGVRGDREASFTGCKE